MLAGTADSEGEGLIMTVRATNMNHALSMARQMDRVTDQLHMACGSVWDAHDLVEIAAALSTVAGRLSEVYDHIAVTASAAGGPVSNGSTNFSDAADSLRAAAVACGYAQAI
jgi:hypothetical protein